MCIVLASGSTQVHKNELVGDVRPVTSFCVTHLHATSFDLVDTISLTEFHVFLCKLNPAVTGTFICIQILPETFRKRAHGM